METLLKFYFWLHVVSAIVDLLALILAEFPKTSTRTVGYQAASTIISITLAIITGLVLYS